MSAPNSWLDSIANFLSGLFGRPTPPTPPPTPPPAQPPFDDSLKTISPRVLVIVFDPVLDPNSGLRLTQSRYAQTWNNVDDLIAGYIADIQECSGGLVQYREVARDYVNDFTLRMSGQRFDGPGFVQILEHTATADEQDLMNYPAFIQQARLVERMAAGEFDEVWMFGFPFAGFSESRMVGQGAYFCNGDPVETTGRRFVMMGFNYERGVGEMLEDLGHRAESVLAHVFHSESFLWWAYDRNRNPAQLDPARIPGLNHLERYLLFDRIAPGQSNVGMLHYAPNSSADYDWGNSTVVQSCADDWLAFPQLPEPPVFRAMNCGEWGGGDIRAHHKWWLKRLPKVAGNTDGILNNWWQYFIQVDR